MITDSKYLLTSNLVQGNNPMKGVAMKFKNNITALITLSYDHTLHYVKTGYGGRMSIDHSKECHRDIECSCVNIEIYSTDYDDDDENITQEVVDNNYTESIKMGISVYETKNSPDIIVHLKPDELLTVLQWAKNYKEITND